MPYNPADVAPDGMAGQAEEGGDQLIAPDRIREGLEGWVDRQERATDAVRDAANRLAAVVEMTLGEVDQPVYAISMPQTKSGPVGPKLRAYLIHEEPRMGDRIEDLDTTVCVVTIAHE